MAIKNVHVELNNSTNIRQGLQQWTEIEQEIQECEIEMERKRNIILEVKQIYDETKNQLKEIKQERLRLPKKDPNKTIEEYLKDENKRIKLENEECVKKSDLGNLLREIEYIKSEGDKLTKKLERLKTAKISHQQKVERSNMENVLNTHKQTLAQLEKNMENLDGYSNELAEEIRGIDNLLNGRKKIPQNQEMEVSQLYKDSEAAKNEKQKMILSFTRNKNELQKSIEEQKVIINEIESEIKRKFEKNQQKLTLENL